MQNYSNIQKFLHDFVLSKKIINKSLFELEKLIYLKNRDITNESHVFITGLPRSGTTALLYFFYSSNEFSSLTYNNMPFILSPNFSKLIYKKNITKKKRLHGDAIDYDNNSPEALDEVFFNNDVEFVKNELANYIQLILFSNKKIRYLSKNNLNYKRIEFIHSILPNSIFLIPIREPLKHAYSLLKQHLNFTKLQKQDDFIKRYMSYLGHNEFGLHHKPWNNNINFKDLNKIDYWIEQWRLFYSYIYDKYKHKNNVHFVIYEKLNDINYINIILKNINLEKNKNLKKNYFKKYNNEFDMKYDKNNYNKAKLIYGNFLRQA